MVTGLNHLTISVADLDRAFRFYAETLGLQPVARWYKGAYLTAGDLWLCLTLEPDSPRAEPLSTYDHFALTVSPSDFEPLTSRLRTYGVTEWQQNRSEGASFYFLDPDSHKLEIHVSNLDHRIESLKRNPPRDLILFQPASRSTDQERDFKDRR